MIEYQFESRDGKTYTFESDKELSNENIAYISSQINPAQTSDYFAGAAASVAKFGYNTLETAHEVGNFVGDVISKAVYGTTSRDVPNPWSEFKEVSDKHYTGDIPQHVKDGLGYKVVQAGAQLAPMLALKPLSAVTLASQGFAAGRDDFINEIGKPIEQMSDDELEAARAVGAMTAIPTMVLEYAGLARLAKGLTGNTSSSAFAEVGKMFLTEGGTEALEAISANIVAKDIAGYDLDRERTEGAGESFLIGGIVGGGAGATRYAPALAAESFTSTYKASRKSIDFVSNMKSVNSLIDVTSKGLANASDMGSDLGSRVLDAAARKGVDFRPLVNGGVTVAKSISDKIKEATNSDYLQNALWTIDKVIRPLKSNVKPINERLAYLLDEFEFNTLKRANNYLEGFKPAIDAMLALDKKDYNDLHKALLQKDFPLAEQIFNKSGSELDWSQVGGTLKTVYDDAKFFGSSIGHIEQYFPRYVKNYKDLADRVGVEIADSQWEKAKKNAEEIKGEPLTTLEEGALFEQLVTQVKFESVEAGKPSALKERQFDIVGDDLLDLYHMPHEALTIYANQMADHIARLEYVGAVDGLLIQQEEANNNILNPEDITKAKRVGTTFIPRDKLPKSLAGATPRYRNSEIRFQSDVDKALYIAQASSGKRRNDYLRFASKALGIPQEEAIEYGKYIKDQLAGLYAGNPGGLLSLSKNFASIRESQGIPEDAETQTLEELPKGSVSRRKVGKIGQVISEEISNGNLTPKDLDKLYDLLGSRFQRKTPMSGFIRGTKTLTYLAFLGSPLSTITQLGDFAYTIHKNGIQQGLLSAGKVITGKDGWTLDDINLTNRELGFEFDKGVEPGSFSKIPDKLQKTLDRVFEINQFRRTDETFKETFLNSTVSKWNGILSGKDTPHKRILEQRFRRLQGNEQGNQTIQDIKAGRKTENVAEMLFYELGGIAPISQSDMPYYYNKYPNLRLLYTLKSYTLKQFDFARREAFSKMFSGDKEQIKEGYKNLISLVISLGLANAPAEVLKSLITGDDLSFDDLVTENLWRLLGLNSYMGVIMQRDGVGSALETLTFKLPVVQVIDDIGKDIVNFAPPLISSESKTTKYVPFTGKLIDKWQKNYGEEED